MSPFSWLSFSAGVRQFWYTIQLVFCNASWTSCFWYSFVQNLPISSSFWLVILGARWRHSTTYTTFRHRYIHIFIRMHTHTLLWFSTNCFLSCFCHFLDFQAYIFSPNPKCVFYLTVVVVCFCIAGLTVSLDIIYSVCWINVVCRTWMACDRLEYFEICWYFWVFISEY